MDGFVEFLGNFRSIWESSTEGKVFVVVCALFTWGVVVSAWHGPERRNKHEVPGWQWKDWHDNGGGPFGR